MSSNTFPLHRPDGKDMMEKPLNLCHLKSANDFQNLSSMRVGLVCSLQCKHSQSRPRTYQMTFFVFFNGCAFKWNFMVLKRFGSTGDRTRGFLHALQVLYHGVTTQSYLTVSYLPSLKVKTTKFIIQGHQSGKTKKSFIAPPTGEDILQNVSRLDKVCREEKAHFFRHNAKRD